MATLFSLTYLLLFLELAASSHFRGGIVQWRPLNNNPMSFNGLVEITFRIAWRRSSGSNFCDSSTITSRTLLGYGALTCRSGCSGSIGSLTYYCTDYSSTEDWSAGERTYNYNAGSLTSIEASYASCCWISLNQGGGRWEIRVKMNLSPRSDNGLINSSPISNMPPIVRVQRSCNGRIVVPVSDADGDDVRCRWASSSRGECSGVCQTFPATLTGCALTFSANSLSTGWYGVALQIEDFASTTSSTPMSSTPLQFLVFVFSSSAACASRPALVSPTPPDGSCYPVASGSTWSARIVAQSGSSSVSITDIVTASPSGLTKSSLRSLGSNQWYVDVTWSPSSTQTGPSIFCYYAQDSVGLSSIQFCITLLGRVTPPRPVSMSPVSEILSTNREWTIVFDQPFRRPTRSKYIRIYDGNTQVLTVDATSTSLVTYPSSNLGRSLIFRTSYNFVTGRSYNIRLDEGVAVDNTYCGLNSTAITTSSFWSVTVVVCFSGMVRLVSSGSYDFEGRVEVCVNGGWGTVCDDGWDTTDAGVLCRQLNLTTSGITAFGGAQYGQGTGPILIDDIACSGTEVSLQSCTYNSNTGGCSHAEDAGVQCHSLPTVLAFGGIGRGLPSVGQYVYFWISPWTSAGVTVSVTLSSGYVVCYASDRFQTPSNLPGYADWTVTLTNEYTEVYIDPSTLGRPIGSFLSFAFLGRQSNNNFTVQVDSGRVLTTALTISALLTRTLGNGGIAYYNLPYPSNGLTLTLTVTSGRIVCYASVSVRNPTESNYDWKVDTTGREEAYLDPAILSQVGRPRVFIALVGRSSSNTFTLNSTRGGSSAVEITVGTLVNTTVAMNRFLYFYLPFSTNGVTIRIDALLGGIRCYASDTNRRPSSTSYVWTLLITDYDDSFLDPSSLGRAPGSTVYIALQGVNAVNNFTMNTTIGDTSIQDVNLGGGLTVSIGAGVTKYYAVPFSSGGITLRLDVSIGYITCYASDIIRNPGPGNYVWLINTRGYADGFIDPTQFGRSGTRYIYVALVGVDPLNTFSLNSTSGNFSSQEVSIGGPVFDSIASGRFRFYIFPFLTTGVTVRVEVFRGGVWCYASDTNRNPNSRNYIWRLFISGYNDSYIDPRSLARVAGPYLFIAIEGVNPANDFSLNSTSGDTSIADVSIGTVVGDTIANGIIKFYSFPFPTNGITLSLTVPSGYVNCYASDRYRNPNQYEYDWFVDVRNYWEIFLDPQVLMRPVGSFLYVSFLGVNPANVYQVNSSSGNILTVEPEPPTNFQAGSILPTTATISWTISLPSRVTPWSVVFNFEIVLTEYAFGLPNFVTNTTAQSYTFTALEEFNNYTVVVAAQNTVGLGNFSTRFNFSTPQAAPTAPPRNPTASRVDATPTLITLSWLPPETIHINGIIDHYVVMVTEVYTGRVFTLRAEDVTILVGPLHPFYVYECQVAAFTVGLGPFGQPFIAQAGETEPTAAPQNISFASRNASSITLSWNPPPFEHQNGLIRSYAIIVTHLNSGSQWQITTNSSITNYTVGGLQPFMNYTFSLAAETIDLGPYSISVTIGTVEGVPTVAPDNLAVSVVSSTALYISWNSVFTPVGDVRDYIVRILEVDTGLVTDIRSAATYITVPVHPAYTYNCSVSAVTVSNGPFSTEISVLTLEDAPSGSPQNISALLMSSRSVILRWNPPPLSQRNGEIVSYTINVTGVESEEEYQLTSTTANLTLSSLRPYFTYSFAISASTLIGEGPFGTVFTIRMPEDVPSAPVSVNVGRIEGQPHQLAVTWQPPLTPNGLIVAYRAYCFVTSDDDVYGSGYLGEADSLPPLSTESMENITSNATVLGSEMLTIVGGLEPYTRYACFVSAFTSVGEGEHSYASSAVTAESAPASPPVNFVAEIVGSTYILLSWSPPAIPNGRIISYTITYNLTGQLTSVVVEDREQYSVTGLEPFSYYQLTVFASTSVGDGPPTLPIIQRTAISNPSGVPVNFTAIATDTTSAQFTWQPPSADDLNGILSYYVLRIVDESYNLTDITINITNTSYIISTLEEYVNYSCQVAAATEVGVGPFGNPIVITTQQDVPTAPPQLLRGSVESSTLILLSWDPPPPYDRNGEIVYYLIHMTERETGRFWTLPVFNRKTSAYVGSLHPYYHYECRVAANTISLGPYSNSIVLLMDEEAPSSSPMTILPLMVTETSYTLTWQPPPYEGINGVIRQYVIQILEVNSGRIFTEVSNDTEITLEGLHPFYSYTTRIAAETIGVGPFSIPITVQLNEDVPTSPPVLTSYYAIDSTTLFLSWISPPVDQQNGIIRRYDLILTELDTGTVFSYSTSINNFTVSLLHPNYQYQIEISAFTVGSGPSSTPLIVLTPEDAPSSAPKAVTVNEIFSDSFELMWSAPPYQDQNGDIIGYNITVTSTSTQEIFTVFSVTNNTIVSSLSPFTTYTYSVAAVTIAGIGPYSVARVIRTDEAAPASSPEELNVTTIASSSVSLTWSPPPVNLRNGIIREYKINVSEVETGRELEFYSSTSAITISTLHPFYTYLCRVSAFTVEYGPYTEDLVFMTLEDVPSGFPQSVSVSTISSRAVELSWNPPSEDERNGIITGYLATLTRRDTGSQTQLFSSTTSISFSMLNPFTSYTVTIAASTVVGFGPQSTQFRFTTSEDVPVGPPTNPLGVAIDSRTLSFSWNEPLEEDRNGIIRGYSINLTEVDTRRVFQVDSSTTSISVSSLHPYYTYLWAVSAFTIGQGPFSTTQTITTPQDVPSGAPQSFTAISTGVTTISLAWEPPLPADRNGIITGYTVSLSSVSSTETRTITTTLTNLTVTSLSPYSIYECIVVASTSVGAGPPTNIILVQTEETNPIGTPSNTSGVALNSTHIFLDWDPLPLNQQFGELREYRITVNELETNNTMQLSSAPDVTEATIGPLHPYYTYNCSILAVTVGEGPPSTVITVRTAEDIPSGSPVNLTALAVSSTSVQLSWTSPPPEERNGIIRQFLIYVQPLSGEPFTITTAALSSFIVSGLRPFTSYLFSVAAITIGPGPATQQSQVQTFTDVPSGAPESLSVQPLNSTSLTVYWEPPLVDVRNGMIQQYTVQIRETETNIVTTLSTDHEPTSVTVTSLHPYYTYSVTVAAGTTAGVGPFSHAVELQLPESAPSSPPTDVQFNQVTSTSFTLFWAAPPPQDHNGLLRHYIVRCTELESGVFFQRFTVNATTERLVDSLHPYYNYNCAVAAVTVVEGPFSPSVAITTTQDVPTSAPIGLDVVSQSSTSVTVSWSPPQSERQNGIISRYSVNVTKSNSGESSLLSTADRSITLEQLDPFTTYLISVAAQTAIGLGPYTLPLTVTTNEDAPMGVPVSLEVVSSTSTSLTLSWSPPPGDQLNGLLRHYLVIIEEVDSQMNTTLTSISPQLTLSDLHPFYTYRIAVCPVTVDTGPCAYFDPVQLPQAAPSGFPVNVAATSLSSTSVLLSWNPPLAEQRNGIITEYYINVTEIETGSTSQLVARDTTQLFIDTLHPYYVYNFFIAAATSVGPGPYSPVFTIQTPEDVPSSPPLNSSGEVLGPSAISISWQPPSPEGQNGIITSYTVFITEVPTNATTTYQRDGSRSEILITGLHPFYEYSCSVAAETSVGLGPFGTPFTITTHQDAPSSPPQNVQGTVASSTSIELIWEPPLASNQNGIIQHYLISVTEFETMRSFQLMSTTTTISATGLHPYYTYSFTIAAVTVGEGPHTQALTLQTLEDAPSGPPQSFRVVAISSTSIRLTWTAPLPEEQNGVITSYRITVTEVESGQVLQRTTSGSDSLIIISSLRPHFTYRCAIAAYTIALGSETTAEVTTLQEAPSGSPRNATVYPVDSSRVQYNWLPPAAGETNGIVIGYIVRVTGQDSNEMIELQTNETNIQVDSLHPFYSYVFTVAAHTEAGRGPFSSVVYLQLPSAAPNGAVSNMTVLIDSSTSVIVTWLPINPTNWNGILTTYTVQYQRQGQVGSLNTPSESYVTSKASIPSLPEHPLANSPDPRLVTLPLNEESLRLEGLEENYVYEFSVYCENSAGQSDSSELVSISMPSSVPDGAPMNVTVEVKSSTTIFISWQPPEKLKQNGIITSYNVEINSSIVSVPTRKRNLSADSTNVTVTGLEKYADFLVAVAAGTSLGRGPFSTPVAVKTLEDVPGVPLNLVVEKINSSAVRLSWSPPLSGNGIILDYQVHYDIVSYKEEQIQGSRDIVLLASTKSQQEAEISNLTDGLTYIFKVRARTSAGYGNFTATKKVELPPLPPVSEDSSSDNSGTIAVAVVFAVLAWIILIVVIVTTVAVSIWYKRRRQTTKLKLGLPDSHQGGAALKSYETKDEDIESDVIPNTRAIDDNQPSKVDLSKTIEDQQDTDL